MNQSLLFLLFLSLMVAGCGTKPDKEHSEPSGVALNKATSVSSSERFHTFYVYQDKGSRNNHYTPSGFMPDGKCLRLDDGFAQNCFSGDTCLRASYDLECSRKGERWAGVYWLNPPNNWGKRKGGYNLKGATQLTFYAKGERGGEKIQEFTIGGITGDFPDSDMIVIGSVILSKTWKQYTIDLRGKDLSYISGGFSWTTNVESNDGLVVFYLDEIKFE